MMPEHHQDILRGLALIQRHAALVPQFVAAASAPDAALALLRAQLRSPETGAPPPETAPVRFTPQLRVA